MRIPISGQCDEALAAAATDARELISGADFDGDGKVFVLEELELSNEHVSLDGFVELWDADEGAAPTATLQRGGFTVPAASTVKLSWRPGTGPRFRTSICATATQGTFAAQTQRCSGYLE